jgi:hypothetical protein
MREGERRRHVHASADDFDVSPRFVGPLAIRYRLSAIPRWYVEGTMLSTEVRRLANQ